jgi:hypothetical protein
MCVREREREREKESVSEFQFSSAQGRNVACHARCLRQVCMYATVGYAMVWYGIGMCIAWYGNP